MAKRQRQVFYTDRIAHLWAHQTQDSARNKLGNFYFTGDTIYSYGGHFPIARIVEHKRRKAVFFTRQDWSVTTAKHKSIVWGAIPRVDMPCFRVDNVNGDVKQARQEYLDRVKQARKELAESRNKIQRAARFVSLSRAIDGANQFLEFFGYKKRLALADFFTPEQVAEHEANIAAVEQTKRDREAKCIAEAKRKHEEWLAAEPERRAAETKRRQEAEEAARKAEEEFAAKREGYIAAWRAGEKLDYWTLHRLPTMLRVKGENVETSQGVEFPLAHARRFVPVVKALYEHGRTYQRNGHTIHLGHYALDRIDETGTVYAGCHVVPREEIERLIATLEAMPAEANGSALAVA